MNLDYLDFEQPIADLEGKIQALCNIKDQADIAKEMEALKAKSNALTKKIFSSLSLIIEKYNPDEIAIEAPFFGKNVQSMLKLGRAQGVAMAAGLVKEIPITEYSPKKIKMAITGNGNSSKEQVAKMLKTMLDIKEMPKNLDSTDGLAAAVCHYFNFGNSSSKKEFSNWASYISKNPDKLV